MSTWSKDNVIQFIEVYRTNECLWKVTSKSYRDRLEREKAYEILRDFTKTVEPSADRYLVLKKINALRTTFRKEVRKVEASRRSGAGPEELYRPKLWYYKYMLFLKDQELPAKSSSSLQQQSAHLSSTSRPNGLQIFSGAETKPAIDLGAPEDQQTETLTRLSDPAQDLPYFKSPESSCSHVSLQRSPSPGSPHHHTQSSLYSTASHETSARQPLNGTTSAAAKRSTKRKLYNEVNDCDEDDQDDEEDEEMPNSSRVRRLLATATAAPPPPPALNENESFGQTIGLLLSKTSKEQSIYARKLMFEVLSEAELGTLSRRSYFVAIPDDPDKGHLF